MKTNKNYHNYSKNYAANYYNDNHEHDAFSEHPFSALFYQYIDTVKSRGFHKEAEELMHVAKYYYLPENRKIITKIVSEMQKAALFDEANKFKQLF